MIAGRDVATISGPATDLDWSGVTTSTVQWV